IWIGGHHSIYIRPDFNLVGPHTRSYDSCRKVGTAAADSGSDAFVRRRDKSAHDRHTILIDERAHERSQPCIRIIEQRCGTGEGIVRYDAIARVNETG